MEGKGGEEGKRERSQEANHLGSQSGGQSQGSQRKQKGEGGWEAGGMYVHQRPLIFTRIIQNTATEATSKAERHQAHKGTAYQ